MAAYPVRYAVDKPDRFTRFGLVLRVLVLLTLGAFGVSLAAIFFVVCLSLPALAAGLLADRGTRGYLATDAPRILRVLRWLAAIYGWLGWATDALPSRSPEDTIRVDVEIGSTTAPRAAMSGPVRSCSPPPWAGCCVSSTASTSRRRRSDSASTRDERGWFVEIDSRQPQTVPILDACA
jgi:hypothetical protein